MIRRTTRRDQDVDCSKLLEAIGTCRQAVLDEQTKARVGSALYYSCSTVTAAIDGLALILTGQRDYFALKFHGGGWPGPSC